MSATVRDPVCGMVVDPAQFETSFEGPRYAFFLSSAGSASPPNANKGGGCG